MIQVNTKLKVEYGDFQTPLELAEKVCQKLRKLGVSPGIIVEPTCGMGNFIQAAVYSFPSTSKIIGVEINQNYLQEIERNNQLLQDKRIEVQQGDFFKFDWSSLLNKFNEKILIFLGLLILVKALSTAKNCLQKLISRIAMV